MSTQPPRRQDEVLPEDQAYEQGYENYQQYQAGYKNYFPAQLDTATGFKYRVGGERVVRKTLAALRGEVTDADGTVTINKDFQLMNEKGIARARLFLEGLVNSNTHLSRFRDERRVLRQIQSLAKEWCVTLAINRKRWKITDLDLVQQVIEQAILVSLNRADEGFEASLSAKSHHVHEQVSHHERAPPPKRGLFGLFRGPEGGY